MGAEERLGTGWAPMSGSAPSAVWLLGRDYPSLGPVALVAHPRGGALGISRGRLPKPYPHVEPNEDAALLVHTERGVLLGVVDGFNGADAALLTIEAVREAADDLVVAEPKAFDEAIGLLLERMLPQIRAVAPANTTLVVMALYGSSVHVASFGDSVAYRASRADPIIPPESFWLARDTQGGLEVGAHTEHFRREAGERLAVVSDGVTNFVPDPGQISGWLEKAPTDRAAARLVLEEALAGGAGDNVAVVTFGGDPP